MRVALERYGLLGLRDPRRSLDLVPRKTGSAATINNTLSNSSLSGASVVGFMSAANSLANRINTLSGA